VAGARAADVGGFDEFADHAAQNVRIERFAVAGEKEGFFSRFEGEERADGFEVVFKPYQDAVSDG